MRRVTLGNCRFGNRQQAIHQRGKILKFLRRTAHIVPMITLFANVAALSASQPSSDQRNQPNNSAPITREHYESDIRAITDEMKAMRDDIAKKEQQRAEQEQHWYIFSDRAPVWSNWFLFIAAVVAGRVAYRAFNHERDAVMLTQRADLLMHSVAIWPRMNPCILSSETTISIIFKNLGPTRASNVIATVDLEIRGVTKKPVEIAPKMPPSVVGANEKLTVAFPPLGVAYEDQPIRAASRGDVELRFDATVHYTDVFGKNHHTTCSGTYYGAGGTFVTDKNHDAD